MNCKKRPAVVFVSTTQGNKKSSKGYCLLCAKKLGIAPIAEMLDTMGITDDQLETMQDQFNDFMEAYQDDGDFRNENEGFFQFGGVAPLPFIQNLFSNLTIPGSMTNNLQGNPQGEKSSSEKASKNSNNTDDKNVENIDENINENSGFFSNNPFKMPNQSNKKRRYVDTYCYNLNKKALNGQLDKIIGRDKEISRIIQILTRRTKNNPCLIGEPGVGKTAIAEALAIDIVNSKVPSKLKDKQIEILDLTALVAGTQFRGQFESRIKGLIQEVKQAGNIILFIDEIHNLIGSSNSEASVNIANILKPALSRGEIQVIGATTFSEYSKYIEKDSALERRFQPVAIMEPSIDDTIEIIKGIKEHYEQFHKVHVSDKIAKKSVVLSERYITDRFLPDKAIDLLDEACACCALRNPAIAEYDDCVKEWDNLVKREELLTKVENINYEELAKIRTEIAKMDKKIQKLSEKALNCDVSENDLAHVIELWTGIPASKVAESEIEKLSNIEDTIKNKIVGQDEAVDLISAAVRRSRVQINPRKHPASFIFVGPTGVGKTELARVLSTELFDSPETLIRLDMSEFMEKHSVSRIIGSPPGYVGYDERGQITEKVRRKPYSVLLFDEIEKAHPDVLNILLQILDEGRITDSHGRTVNFENTIIIMTSNAGSDQKSTSVGFEKSQEEISREHTIKALEAFLRPEFLSRIDEIVIFRQLNEDDFVKISAIMLNEYVSSLEEKGIKFKFDKKAQKWLAHTAIGHKSAARDLRNLIRKEVEDKIATALISQHNDIKSISLTAGSKGIKLNIT